MFNASSSLVFSVSKREAHNYRFKTEFHGDNYFVFVHYMVSSERGNVRIKLLIQMIETNIYFIISKLE